MSRNEFFNRIKKKKEWKRNIGAKERMTLDTNVMVVEYGYGREGEVKKFRRGKEDCLISLYFIHSNTILCPLLYY